MGSFQYGMLVEQVTSTATSGGTTSLSNTSKQIQDFTGTSSQTVKLPPTTSMSVGQFFEIYNSSTGTLTMQYQDGTSFTLASTVSPGTSLVVKLVSTGTTNGTWVVQASSSGSGSGSKNYLTSYVASTSSSTPNSGNGNFEQGSTSGWSIANTALSSVTPTSVNNPGAAYAGSQYLFTISAPASNVTAGATYTNNSQTFTVVNSITTSQTLLVCTGTGAPTASGTLTKSTGTGPSTITFSAFKLTTASANLSLSVVSSSQLSGSYSGDLASSAASTAGDMLISNTFFIDTEDQAKMMTVQFHYEAVSGTFNFSGSSSNTFAIWIYDVTNAAWIMPAGVYGMVQGSGVGYATNVTFQTTSNSTQYQLALININATSGAYSLYVDDFILGPQTAPSGPAMTDWQSYTPVYTNLGSTTSSNAYYKRVGDTLAVYGNVAVGSIATAVQTIGLPSGLAIDYTKIATNDQIVGTIERVTTGGSWAGTSEGPWMLFTDGSTTGSIFIGLSGASSTSITKSNTVIASSGDTLEFSFTVPVVGWSSNTQMSSDTDTRVVAFSGSNTAGTSVSSSNTVIPFVPTYDTHGGWSSSNSWYVVPVSGYYRLTAGMSISATGSLMMIYQNGSQVNRIGAGIAGTSSSANNGAVTVKCNAGDTLQLQAASNGGGTQSLNTTAGFNYFTIERISGPAVIASTETVAIRYYVSPSTLTVGANVQVNYDTKIFDTHEAVTTGSNWKFTAPVSGKYNVSVGFNTSSGNAANGLYKNGSIDTNLAYAINTFGETTGSTLIQLNAGDFIDMRPNGSITYAGGTAPYYTWICVYRIGN